MTKANQSVDAAGQDDVPAAPMPPRYWWLKRLLIGGGALLLLLIGWRVWWGWDAHRQLQAEIDKLIAAGEPIYPEDFDSEYVPDDQNAAKMLKDAISELQLTPAETELIGNVSSDLDAAREKLDELKQVVDNNTAALQLVRRARDTAGLDWHTRIRSPAISTLLPYLSGHRQVGKILAATAFCHHLHANDGEALATIHDALAHATTLDHQPILISHLVAVASQALAARVLEEITPELSITGGGETGSAGATRLQIVPLIERLLADSQRRDRFVRAMYGERMFQFDIVQQVILGNSGFASVVGVAGSTSLGERLLLLPLRPLLELDAVRVLRYGTRVVEAVGKDTYADAQAALRNELDQLSPLDSITHFVSGLTIYPLDRSILLHFRSRAMDRMAAVALAIRLHELDHGRRPATLDELVPEYLPAVPVDPFGSNGRTISYKPSADPPILYSIGSDGVDDDGRYALFGGGGVNLNKLDQPFFMNGDRPRPKD